MLKRAGRLLTGNDVLYTYDAHPRKSAFGSDYGGWTIAPEGLGSSSTIYSFGLGNDASFDLALIARFGCSVHGFDPSPPVAKWIGTQNLPPEYFFHDYGLGAWDGEITFFCSVTEQWHVFHQQSASARKHYRGQVAGADTIDDRGRPGICPYRRP